MENSDHFTSKKCPKLPDIHGYMHICICLYVQVCIMCVLSISFMKD